MHRECSCLASPSLPHCISISRFPSLWYPGSGLSVLPHVRDGEAQSLSSLLSLFPLYLPGTILGPPPSSHMPKLWQKSWKIEVPLVIFQEAGHSSLLMEMPCACCRTISYVSASLFSTTSPSTVLTPHPLAAVSSSLHVCAHINKTMCTHVRIYSHHGTMWVCVRAEEV